MENYEKGEVVHCKIESPFKDEENVVFMKVNNGSKIRNLMTYALKCIKDKDDTKIAWEGSGAACSKVISCVEIMKRNVKNLHQITEIQSQRTEEYWDPKIEGLARLKVNRDVPSISVLLSKSPLDSERNGYQSPESDGTFWKPPSSAHSFRRTFGHPQEFYSASGEDGLPSIATKPDKKHNKNSQFNSSKDCKKGS